MSESDIDDYPLHSEDFTELDGSDLELQLFIVSHGPLWFRATGPKCGIASLGFGDTVQIDCPAQMHGIRLREAGMDETKDILKGLPSDQYEHLQYRKLFRITCREGIYSIWAYGGCFYYEENPVVSVYEEKPMVFTRLRLNELTEMVLDRSLWKNGPPLRSL